MFRAFHYQVRGRGHVLDGVRGQDRTAYLARNRVQVMCLSDGAGSATHAEFGAQALVDAGCRLLVERFSDFVASQDGASLKLEIVEYLLERLGDVAERQGVQIRDLAATFLAVAAAGDKFLILHVGDGVIGYVKDGSAQVASGPDNSEFANQTSFVTSKTAAGAMRILRGDLNGVDGFIMMSDGTANSLYDSRTEELAPACLKIVARLSSAPTTRTKNPEYRKQLRRLIDTKVRFATKDDCSIGVLARKSG
ncbi:PP2C family serine/threonine-protein phosphatase [Mumia quercus]|uniref:PP2C family serine/threonine-protein phosphatase n=1 Tax=Mumia quercus TaxID=2976125 RepID=UPI0021D3A696|nr:PP2C family serine/threonine-protein phosphatase [Mumia quercus]